MARTRYQMLEPGDDPTAREWIRPRPDFVRAILVLIVIGSIGTSAYFCGREAIRFTSAGQVERVDP